MESAPLAGLPLGSMSGLLVVGLPIVLDRLNLVFGDKTWWQRILPLLPPAAGGALALVPGVVAPELGWAAAVVVGIMVGATVGQGHKVYRQSIRGDGAGRGEGTGPSPVTPAP